MIFSKAATTSAPLLEIPERVWTKLVLHLRRESDGTRESGAFLLGHIDSGIRVVTRFLPYEQLQDDALNDDYVSLAAGSFSKLWDVCNSQGLTVVADVHTHRLGAAQSRSDRTNPMIALAGHIALILPHFAQDDGRVSGANLYVYQGNHRWISFVGSGVERRLRLVSGERNPRGENHDP